MSMNVKIVNISDDAEKTLISRKILESLTDWFGIKEARELYIAESCGKDFFCAFDEQNPIGFLYMKQTGNATVEVAVIGVLPQHQRMGVGRDLFKMAKKAMKSKGFSFIQVKTVQLGKYDIYDKTNKFYISLGFKEFEVLPTLWDEANPCQIYVMSI